MLQWFVNLELTQVAGLVGGMFLACVLVLGYALVRS